MIRMLEERGFGEITQPYEYPPRRLPWALDNGAFADWKAERPFDAERFLSTVQQAGSPDYVVVPDVVAGGLFSLATSLAWADVLEPYGHPMALVVQDGMVVSDVEPHLGTGRFAFLFVGGTVEWKVATGAEWVELAHRFGMKCHIGRVGTQKRVRWAKRVKCDSIDSCLPLWSEGNLRRFCEALAEDKQIDLWEDA